jgi:hypothetical protein
MALGLIGGTIDHAKRLIDLCRNAGRDAGHPDEQRSATKSHRQFTRFARTRLVGQPFGSGCQAPARS